MEEYRTMQGKWLDLERERRTLVRVDSKNANAGKEQALEQTKLEKQVDNCLRKLFNMKLDLEDIVDCYLNECIRVSEQISNDIDEQMAKIAGGEGGGSELADAMNAELELVVRNRNLFKEYLNRGSSARANIHKSVFKELLQMNSEELGKLKRVLYSEEMAAAASAKSVCPVCAKGKKAGEVIVQLSCSHELHKKCGENRLSEDARCPICEQFSLLNYDA